MLYQIGKALSWLFLTLFFRVKVIGKHHLPKSGPTIVCSNHTSNFDPPVVGVTNPRPVSFLAKEELFSRPILKWLMTHLRAIPVRRGMSDRGALKKGLEVLKEGHVMGLFPEGSRSKTGELKKGLAGAGFFALRSKAYVVPCAIKGPYKLFGKVTVIYGEPIDFETLRKEKVSAQEATDVIMSRIQSLLDDHAA